MLTFSAYEPEANKERGVKERNRNRPRDALRIPLGAAIVSSKVDTVRVLIRTWTVSPASSNGRRNTCLESIRRRLEF